MSGRVAPSSYSLTKGEITTVPGELAGSSHRVVTGGGGFFHRLLSSPGFWGAETCMVLCCDFTHLKGFLNRYKLPAVSFSPSFLEQA